MSEAAERAPLTKERVLRTAVALADRRGADALSMRLLMESRTQPGPANLRHREATLGILRRAGFSVAAATHANWLLDSYLYGFALQVATLPFDTKEQLADMAEQVFIPLIPADHFPHLHEAAAELVATGYVRPCDRVRGGARSDPQRAGGAAERAHRAGAHRRTASDLRNAPRPPSAPGRRCCLAPAPRPRSSWRQRAGGLGRPTGHELSRWGLGGIGVISWATTWLAYPRTSPPLNARRSPPSPSRGRS